MLEVAQTASQINVDDSHLARTKDLITNIRTRIQVAEKLISAETEYHEEIPIDEPNAEDISARIAEYFETDHPEVAAVVGAL